MGINFSDTINQSFVLNNKCLSKTFQFTLSDFYLYIKNVHFILQAENENWYQLIRKTVIRLHVKYNYNDQALHEHYNEISFPIHLFVDSNKMQPYFTINKLIDKQIFSNDFDMDKFDKIFIRIELIEKEIIHVPYHVEIDINCTYQASSIH